MYSHSLNNDIGRKKSGSRDQGEKKACYSWKVMASEWGMESTLDKASVWKKLLDSGQTAGVNKKQ